MLYFFLFIFSLIGILFLTLLERKFLGVLNNRKAPNFYMVNSLLQSLMDFLKLLFKSNTKMNFVMKSLWNLMILYGLIMFVLLMMNFPLSNSILFFYLNFFFFFLIYSLMAFFFLILSFSSNSMYSLMAMYRVLIQIMSYEVGLIFLFLIVMIIMNLFNYFYYYNYMCVTLLFSLMYIMMLMITSLSEMNRTPFDFLESETELVSGFNVEYLASLFSMIFLIEYGLFLYYNMLLVLLLNLNMNMILMLMLMFILIRSFMPRYRYDKMMYFFWKDLMFIVFLLYMFFMFF